jgi:acetyl esterase/lipase
VAFPAVVLVGGFAPALPFVGRFGAFLDGYLPWLALTTVAAAFLAALAVGLGGGRLAAAILSLTLVSAAGLILVATTFLATAAQLGADFSFARQLTPRQLLDGPDDRITFAQLEDGVLHADVWHGAAGAAFSPPSGAAGPAIVYAHGGGFAAGALGSRPSLFQAFAAAGITVIDVEYRLTPPPRWADAPADVLCALSWVGAAANTLDIDPTRVFVMGESAGGSLALVAGYGAGSGLLEASCVGEPIVPAGVIAIAPAADLAGIWADRTLFIDGKPFPESYTGGTPAEVPDRFVAASPERLIREVLPSTLIITGANDHLVLPNRVTSLAARLVAGGVDTRLVAVPFADHGFDGDPNGFGAQIEEHLVVEFVRDVTD